MPDQMVMDPVRNESTVGSVSIGAVLAGALVACAATLILVMVGAGLGFSSVSPWADQGVSSATFGVATAIWLIVVQWLAAGLGGYMAGRLRTPRDGLRDDESFFRDTAHGLLTWALATLVGATLLGSLVTEAVGTGASGVAAATGGLAQTAMAAAGPVNDYDLDTLLRPRGTPNGAAEPRDRDVSSIGPEVMRILSRGMTAGDVPAGDRDYLAQIISDRAGIPREEAQQRVAQTIERGKQAVTAAQQAADSARKAAAKATLFGALALLIGALVASAAAGYGGRLRDEVS